jgi:hypothetical protein
MDDLIKAATGGLSGIVDELAKVATGQLKQKVDRVFAAREIDRFVENVDRVGQVRTIFDPDNIVSLTSIFHEGAIQFDGDSFGRFSEFGALKVLVEGGPGQGKSMYLRWLCLNEAAASEVIPIFVEFRNLRYEKSFKEELIGAINDLGLKVDVNLFDFLAESKKILFVLDGFDEVPSDHRLRIARELETVGRAFPKLKILMSSRPESGMGGSLFFRKYKIDLMGVEIQKSFVDKLFNQKSISQEIGKILDSNEFLNKVTTTPLLLTLFSITYNARQFRPDSLSEFYSLIFSTMLYRHDRMKVGFERARKSGLTDFQMQRVFDAFSYLSLSLNKVGFSDLEFKKLIEKAAKIERLPTHLEDYLVDDITNITALIVRDGFNTYAYTHKSIQEYFAASFISSLDESHKENFYFSIISDIASYRKWANTLRFLSTIDESSYLKNFVIPGKRKVLCISKDNEIKFYYGSIKTLIGADSKVKVNEDGQIVEIYWDDTFSSSFQAEYSSFAKLCVKKFLSSKRKVIAKYLSLDLENLLDVYEWQDGFYSLNIFQFISDKNLQTEFCQFLSSKFEEKEFKSEIIRLENEIDDTESLISQVIDLGR